MSFPKNFKRLEYIQSSGTQYINENFVPDATTKVIMDFQMVSPGTANECIFGVAGQFSFRWYGTSSVFRSNGANTVDFPSSVSSTARHTVSKETLTCTIDGAYSVSNTAGKVTLSLYIFAQHTASGASNYAKVRCYSRQVYKNGTLIRDYIPCQNDSGAVGLWDEVNSVFYGNAGTGTFTAGPVVEPPEAPANLQHLLAVRFTWSAVDGATKYNVYRDDAMIGTTTGLFYVDDTAAENTEYTYAVSAVGSGGESAKATMTVYTKSGYFLYKPYVESATFQ